MTAPPTPYRVQPETGLVRPYVLDQAHRERRREKAQHRIDASRLGLAVLMDLAEDARTARTRPAAGELVGAGR
ncbi:hypothetical protein [Nocardiopsis rhodophaea]|uniref:hypothetical protein n=1 Tax=Nocardiopsis rhodophaea TaxID=280238 RepID=UPI0031DBACD4